MKKAPIRKTTDEIASEFFDIPKTSPEMKAYRKAHAEHLKASERLARAKKKLEATRGKGAEEKFFDTGKA